MSGGGAPHRDPRSAGRPTPRPPAPARLLLSFVSSRHREFLVGDLEEEYAQRARRGLGRFRADLWFWRQATGSLLEMARARPVWSETPPLRPPQRGRLVQGLLQDLTYAVRAFRSGRAALAMAAVVLALAIGAATTTYSVVAGVVLRALPYEDPEGLLSVFVIPLAVRSGPADGAPLSTGSVEIIQSTPGVFASTAYYLGGTTPILHGVGDLARVSSVQVERGFFGVLGSRPLMGRAFNDGDHAPGATDVAVVSYTFWRTRMGGDVNVVGRTLTLDDRVHEVVGVMPRGVQIPTGVDLWLPERGGRVAAGSDAGSPQGRYWMIARLVPGVTREMAHARLDSRISAYAGEQPAYEGWGANLTPTEDFVVGSIRKPLLLLLGAVGLVLLIACANQSTVFLARGLSRHRQVAVRLSLGASRARVARQLVLESVLVALAGGAAGIALAWWGVPATVALAGSDLPRASEIGLDWRIAGVALTAILVMGGASGALPAVVAVRDRWPAALKEHGGARSRLGEALVVVQIGLGTVLLAGTALLVVTFVNLMRVDLGFDPSRIVVAEFALPADRYASPEARAAFLDQALARLEALPGVEAVAASDAVPFSGGAFGSFDIVGQEAKPGQGANLTAATPDLPRVLGLELRSGRGLGDPRADATGPREILVNEALAEAFFPGADPIGREIAYYGGSTRGVVVGVVSDTHQRAIDEPAQPQLYAQLTQVGRRMKLSVRTTTSTGPGSAGVRRMLSELEPLLPVNRLGTIKDLAAETVSRQRFYAFATSIFGGLALLITALGVYGVSAYSVSRRLPELGIRMALGASAGRIRVRTLARAAVLGGIGLTGGLAAASTLTHLLEALLFGVTPGDPRVFAGVALMLGATALGAALPSALRAGRVDPMSVLKSE